VCKPELMSSVISGCVLHSRRVDLRFFMSKSHCSCEDCCGHCRMCAVISSSYLHLGHAADSLCQVCAIFFPVAQNPVTNFEDHLFWAIVISAIAVSMLCQSTRAGSLC